MYILQIKIGKNFLEKPGEIDLIEKYERNKYSLD